MEGHLDLMGRHTLSPVQLGSTVQRFIGNTKVVELNANVNGSWQW